MLPFFAADHNAGLSRFCASLVVFLVEFLNATSGVHDFLCSGVKRVAFRANFYVHGRLADGGLGLESIATAASDCEFGILWVNICFHFIFSWYQLLVRQKSTHA